MNESVESYIPVGGEPKDVTAIYQLACAECGSTVFEVHSSPYYYETETVCVKCGKRAVVHSG